MDIATLLQNFTGEKERTAALTAEVAALKTENATLKAAAVAPAPDAAAVAKLAADLASEQKTHADHVAASATVSSVLNFTLTALGIESIALVGKTAAEVKTVVGSVVAAKSAEQLAAAGFSAPLNDAPGSTSAASGDVIAKYEELVKKNPTEAALFFQKNKAAFYAADATSRK